MMWRPPTPWHRRSGELDPVKIKLFWLIKLHWGAIVGQFAVVLLVPTWLGINLPRGSLFLLVMLQGVAMLFADVLARGARRKIPEAAIVAVMAFDCAVLTAMLVLAGGYANPFSMIYVVNVALSAVMLRPLWAWGLLVASLGAFGSLFLLGGGGEHVPGMPNVDSGTIMQLHMRGMWIALAISAALIVYIVQRVTRELEEVEVELAAERSLGERRDRVASLATLASGAAHELSTPLSTIAVVTRELQRTLQEGPPGAQDDLALIKQQISRCQDILHQMSANAGENAGEPIRPLPLAEWADAALANLPQWERVVVRADVDLSAHAVEGPVRGLVRALRSLLKNAIQASPPGEPVELRFSRHGQMIEVLVSDKGSGMAPEVLERVGEPFFTTKVPGEGMGLGLFLTRALAEQLGGDIEVTSKPGTGTTASLHLPAALAFEKGAAA
jgi:two-component system sensor histidine kinase RegB